MKVNKNILEVNQNRIVFLNDDVLKQVLVLAKISANLRNSHLIIP